MGDLRAIPYGFTKEWKTPAETQSGAPADCKAKAVALYERMQAHGAANMRLVIGKRATTSRSTHAWVEWETESGTYVLDPTINWRAYRGKDLGRRIIHSVLCLRGNPQVSCGSGDTRGAELISRSRPPTQVDGRNARRSTNVA